METSVISCVVVMMIVSSEVGPGMIEVTRMVWVDAEGVLPGWVTVMVAGRAAVAAVLEEAPSTWTTE